MRSHLLLIIIVVIAGRGWGIAQTIPEDSLDTMLARAKTCYNNAEYENAIAQLENALRFLRLLKGSDQVEAYKYLAFSYVAFGDKEKAKEQFRKVLALNPKLELDPAIVSPKIIKVFEEAKSEMPAPPAPSPLKPASEPAQPAHPLVAAPPSPAAVPPSPPASSRSTLSAVWRSCLLPGWGQRYYGDRSKGKKITIAAGVSFGASLITGIITNSKHATYKNAAPSNDNAINNTYRSYKLWYNVSSLCVVSFLGIYVYNVGDAIFAKGNSSTSMINPDRGYQCETGSGGVRLCCTIDF